MTAFFDHHVHSVVSGDSAVPLEERARSARGERPHGVSDHFPSPHLRSDDDVLRHVDRAKSLGLAVALEYDVGVARALAPSTRDALDYLVGGLHQVTVGGYLVGFGAAGEYLKRRVREYAERDRFDDALRRGLLEAVLAVLRSSFERDRVDILAHPTFSPLAALAEDADVGYPLEWQDRLIELCVRHGVALEVNESYRLPHVAFLRRAAAAGARFAVGSDSHAALLPLAYTDSVVAEAGISERMPYVGVGSPASSS